MILGKVGDLGKLVILAGTGEGDFGETDDFGKLMILAGMDRRVILVKVGDFGKSW